MNSPLLVLYCPWGQGHIVLILHLSSVQPVSVQPDIVLLVSVQPGTVQLVSVQPDIVQPASVQPV